MKKSKLLGASLATAAALVFSSVPATSLAEEANKMVHCYGVNECKGQSICKTAKSACNGMNECKGQGVIMKTEKECEDLGGKTSES